MKALLLAAGMGTRLQPVTELIPKCLVPIQGKSLLEIWLSTLVDEAGITDILVNLHSKPELVTGLLDAGPHRDYVHLDFEEQLLGTAGTLLKHVDDVVNDVFDDVTDEPLLLIHADNVSVVDWQAFFDAYENRPGNVVMTMMTFTTDQPSNCGIVELDSQQRLIAFHEKVAEPPGNHANAAIYLLTPQLLRQLRDTAELADFSTEVIPSLLGRINCWHNENYHRDIGNIDSLLKAQCEVELSTQSAFSESDNNWWRSFWLERSKWERSKSERSKSEISDDHLLMLAQQLAAAQNGICVQWDVASETLPDNFTDAAVLLLERQSHDELCDRLDSFSFSMQGKILLVGEGDIRCHELYRDYGVICLLICRLSMAG